MPISILPVFQHVKSTTATCKTNQLKHQASDNPNHPDALANK
jgi:hypothetical protein